MDETEYGEEKGLEVRGESRALLVGVYRGGGQKPICEEHLAELQALAETFGIEAVAHFPCSARALEAATYIPAGKVAAVVEALQTAEANMVIFDEEISPAQQRNLEKALRVPVMDRTELILEIFAQRAQTKEARLQIELAQVQYQFPRLKRLWSHFSRQRARGGYLKGEGEKQLEIDKRLLKRKVERLKQELEEVKRTRQTQSHARRRSGIPTCALVGYTNSGKSTLLHALTGADVLIEDKLFATLDPTTRKWVLPNHQEVLLTDTVGFIRKLPHTLVAAFRSTLESALQDDILLHILDASHPLVLEHAETTRQLLEELGAQKEGIVTVLNKIDQCPDASVVKQMRLRFPKTVALSAKTGEGIEELAKRLEEELQTRRLLMKLRIPQSEYVVVAQVRRVGHVLYEEYEENDVILRAEIPCAQAHLFDAYRYE